MSRNGEKFKKTERRGRTKVTSYLPQDHPVVRGVLKAEEMLGGFPDHVGKVRIKPDEIKGKINDTVVGGRCFRNNGPSRIDIYAGSIKACAGGTYLEESVATSFTLHEVGHSRQNHEIFIGVRLPSDSTNRWDEEDAENFVTETRDVYRQRINAHRPRLTMKQLLEQRKTQKIKASGE